MSHALHTYTHIAHIPVCAKQCTGQLCKCTVESIYKNYKAEAWDKLNSQLASQPANAA